MEFEKIIKDISNNLFFFNAEEIEGIRSRVAGSKDKRELLGELGEEVLSLEILSVLSKTRVAPSGDRKDYVSFGTYWWPNPDTEDGLPYVVRDGEFNPEGFEYDKYNMKKTLYSAWITGLLYLITDEDRYLKRFEEVIKIWFLDKETGMNPHLKYAQFIPGICQGRDVGLIDTATLLPFLLNIYNLLQEGNGISEEVDEGLRGWVQEYFSWLYESPHGAGEDSRVNNHGTWHDIQVTALAEFCGRRDIAEKQFLKGLKRFEAQIDDEGKQVFEIGRTRSFNYSVMGLRGQLDLLILGEKIGLDRWNDERVRRSCSWMLPYLTGEKRWEYQQITDIDEEISVYPMFLMEKKLGIKAEGSSQERGSRGIPTLLFR